jgi:hypothetical protein
VLRTLFSGFVGGMPLNAVAFVPPYRPYAPGAVALDKPPPNLGAAVRVGAQKQNIGAS